MEILPPPERVNKGKMEIVSLSKEDGVEDLISFNDGVLLQPRLDSPSEVEIPFADVESDERMESHGRQTCTNPVNEISWKANLYKPC